MERTKVVPEQTPAERAGARSNLFKKTYFSLGVTEKDRSIQASSGLTSCGKSEFVSAAVIRSHTKTQRHKVQRVCVFVALCEPALRVCGKKPYHAVQPPSIVRF